MMAGPEVGSITLNDLRKRRFASFQEMRNELQLCDIILNVGGTLVSAHRVILAAAIPYFRKTCSEGKRCKNPPDIEPNAYMSLIDYAYTCTLNINADNVKSLLVGACYLGMDEVKEACCDYLSASMESEGISSILALALSIKCLKLLEDTDYYVTENFNVISQTTDFLQYPLVYLEELLDKDDLNVENEEQVVDAILRWVKASPKDREKELPKLLSKVRMPFLKPRYLTNLIGTEELVATSLGSRNLIEEARTYNLFPEMRNAVCSFQTHPRQQRWEKFVNQEDVINPNIYQLHAQEIYSFYRIDLSNIFHEYETREWNGPFNKICKMSTGSVVTLQNTMYFFRHYGTLYFDPMNGLFDFMKSMPTPREYTGATALKNQIYVCGGSTDFWKATNVIECFDPKRNRWKTLRAMPTSRWGLNAVAMGDFIFAIGGAKDDNICDNVERYDEKRGKWTPMSSMLCARFLASAAALNGRIYVCGGMSSGVMASAERFDPIDNQWISIRPMSVPRYMFTLLPYTGMLLAVRGMDNEDEEVFDLNIYDPETDEWMLIHPSEDHISSITTEVISSSDITYG